MNHQKFLLEFKEGRKEKEQFKENFRRSRIGRPNLWKLFKRSKTRIADSFERLIARSSSCFEQKKRANAGLPVGTESTLNEATIVESHSRGIRQIKRMGYCLSWFSLDRGRSRGRMFI